MLFGLWYCKCLAVMGLACCATLPRGERVRYLLILPAYPVYALLPYVATAIGFANMLTLKTLGRRLFADHYEPKLSTEPS